MTDDLSRRVREHKRRECDFTRKYEINKLVYYETCSSRTAAAAREKEIKGWKRFKKVALIEKENPEWRDLSERELTYLA